jgi:hypothetical protein
LALVLSVPKVGHERQNVVAQLVPLHEHSVVTETSPSAGDITLPSSLVLSNATFLPSDVDIESASGLVLDSATTMDLSQDQGIFVAQATPASPAGRPRPTATAKSAVAVRTASTVSIDSDSKVPALLQRIGYCESGNRQYDANGNVMRGRVNSNDIGKYQINQTIWGSKAAELGYDIYTEAGNTAMALFIFNSLGSRPWYPSEYCWGASAN